MKKQLAFVMAPALAVALSSAASAGVIYDNGGPDGFNGLSHVLQPGGINRLIADDFVLAGGPGWLVDGAAISGVWNLGGGLGQVLGFRVVIYGDDVGGGPGSIISDQTVALGSETMTGNTFFNRPEIAYTVEIAPVALAADTSYFIAIQVSGGDNFFHLTSATPPDIIGSPVWASFGFDGDPDEPYVPGFDIFEFDSDVTFQLTGEVVPAPGALALLGLAGLAGVRRRRR